MQARLTAWASRLGVSPDLVRALAWMESGYQPGVVSPVGARGVMQVMPVTREFVEQVFLGRQVPQTVDGDIEVGILYLRHLLARFDGDTRLALGAWYQGEAAVRKFGLYKMTTPFVADVRAPVPYVACVRGRARPPARGAHGRGARGAGGLNRPARHLQPEGLHPPTKRAATCATTARSPGRRDVGSAPT